MAARGDQPPRAKEPLRFLLAGFGARGDVVPLFVLARELAARGHAVTVAAPPDFAAEAAARGVAFSPVGTPVQRLFSGPSVSASQLPALVRQELGRHFEALAPLAQGVQLVVGTAGEIAAASVAEAAGAGFLHLALGPQTLPSRHHPPPYVPWPSLPGFLSRAGWGSVGTVLNTLGRSMLNDERRKLGLAGVSDVLAHLLPTRALMAVDPVLGPLPEDLARTALQCGALFEDTGAALSDEVEAFLTAGAPPVLLTFGSMTSSKGAEKTEALLQAVRARGQRALIVRGWGGLGDGARGEDVLVVDRAPLPALLPRTAAVVHHGGAGTVALAARAGVPQVVIPHLLDQAYWGSRVQALGIGPAPLSRGRLSAARIEEALALAESPRVLREARSLAPGCGRTGPAARWTGSRRWPLAPVSPWCRWAEPASPGRQETPASRLHGLGRSPGGGATVYPPAFSVPGVQGACQPWRFFPSSAPGSQGTGLP